MLSTQVAGHVLCNTRLPLSTLSSDTASSLSRIRRVSASGSRDPSTHARHIAGAANIEVRDRVLFCKLSGLLLIEGVDVCRCKLASVDLLSEENIEFVIRAVAIVCVRSAFGQKRG